MFYKKKKNPKSKKGKLHRIYLLEVPIHCHCLVHAMFLLYFTPPNFLSIARSQLLFSVVGGNMMHVLKKTGRVAGSCASGLASLKLAGQMQSGREHWKRKTTHRTDKLIDIFSFRTSNELQTTSFSNQEAIECLKIMCAL